MRGALTVDRLVKIATAGVLALFLVQVVILIAKHDAYFWDFEVYFTAASALWSGENPYEATHPDHPFRYVYPLISLAVFLPLLPLGESMAPVVHLLIQLSALGVLWRYCCRHHIEQGGRVLFTLFFILAFNSSISSGLRAGNVAVYESVLVWMAFACYLRGRFASFASLIVASACFKIVTILFLGILVCGKQRRRWVCLFAGVLAYVGIFGFASVAFPEWNAQMVENIRLLGDASRGALNPSLREFFEDCQTLTGIPNLYPVAAAVVALVTLWRIFAVKDEQLRTMLFVISICLVMPRLKDYSYVVLILPVFYTITRIEWPALRLGMLTAAMVPTHYVTRYALRIPDEESLRSVPFLFWEYSPLLVLAVAWIYCISVLCRSPRPLHPTSAVAD